MSFRRKRMQKATTMLKTATPRERDGADLVLHGLRRFSCGGGLLLQFCRWGTDRGPGYGGKANLLRPVRGPVYGINAFVGNGDGTVSDRATGLMWSRDDSG